MKQKIWLSKSKIKSYHQCPLMLFQELNSKEKKVWDATTQFTFDQGREVETIARNMFSNSVLQDKIANWDKVLYTRDLLKTDKTIFEAAFAKRNIIIQFDMLTPLADNSYAATEIKSSAQFKDDYATDVIIQYWIATLSGINISKFELWYVNKESSSISDNYFIKEDVTQLVKSSERRFWELIQGPKKMLQNILNKQSAPKVAIGSHCETFKCPFKDSQTCKTEQPMDSVLNLPRFTKKYLAFNEGITSVNDVRFDQNFLKYTDSHKIVINSVRSNQLIIDQRSVVSDILKWSFPLNFFDFESLMGAIPLLEGQKPYQQVVFQFSNHIYDGSDKLDHFMYLHESLDNPDIGVMEAMLSCLESNTGSIVAYNAPYEISRIKELSNKYPTYANRLSSLIPRFVDLMDIVKDHSYHPEYKGSYSLKPVSKALLKEFGSYSDSLIKSGSEIAKYYTEMLTTTDMERKGLIRDALIRYSTYDTLNLYLVLHYLIEQNMDSVKKIVEENIVAS